MHLWWVELNLSCFKYITLNDQSFCVDKTHGCKRNSNVMYSIYRSLLKDWGILASLVLLSHLLFRIHWPKINSYHLLRVATLLDQLTPELYLLESSVLIGGILKQLAEGSWKFWTIFLTSQLSHHYLRPALTMIFEFQLTHKYYPSV